MSAAQGVLPGMEPYFAYTWKPRLHPLNCIQNYLSGYAQNDREIFCKRAFIVGRLKILYGLSITIRTLARYLRYLSETGWMRRTARRAYCAVRKVLAATFPSAFPSGAPHPINEVKTNVQWQNRKRKPSALEEMVIEAVRRASSGDPWGLKKLEQERKGA